MNPAEHLAATLTRRHLTLATAESCTGGGLSYELTSVPGSSAFFVGGVIAYHNDIKTDWLDVPAETLRNHGAVSRPVASAMAEQCRSRFKTDLAISITGIAGPSGGTSDKPVGLVYVGAATASGTRVIERQFVGNRAEVRKAAIAAAITLALDILDDRTQATS